MSKEKNIESIIKASVANTNHMQMQNIDPFADYSDDVNAQVY